MASKSVAATKMTAIKLVNGKAKATPGKENEAPADKETPDAPDGPEVRAPRRTAHRVRHPRQHRPDGPLGGDRL